MSARRLLAVAVAVVAALILCTGAVAALFTGTGGDPTLACGSPRDASSPAATVTPGPGGRWPAVGRWSSEQVGNAAAIVAAGTRLGVPPRGWVIALATAMQESNLHNLPGGDRDSVGLFQQRPSQGWGTPDQLHDPVYAATTFYQALLRIPNWQNMALIDAAQAVQRSA